MALANHSSRIYMDEEDVDGLLNVLKKRARELDEDHYFIAGAYFAMNIIRNYRLNTQEDFMQLFDKALSNYRYDGKVERV